MAKGIGDSKELCLRLLKAETEDAVIGVLKDAGYWDSRSAWRPYGDVQNNRSIVGNQQSSAIAAMVEKLVNSIDAVLTYECCRKGIDPRGPDAPRSMRQAVEQFLGVKGGSILNLDATSRTRLAERIRVIAAGTKEHPAYIVIDDGEGQCPDQFPSTFLSLVRDNKTGIPFVQGKYNMGGTGVLLFAGDHGFQLILSRRQPGIPASPEGSSVDGRWGFTITRRLPPSEEQPHSMYVYLAPEGRVLSFDADEVDALPGRYPDLYAEPMHAGTCIKIWNYRLPGRLKTIATLDLRHALERYLQDPPLPVRAVERRAGYRANYYETTVSGLNAVIADSRNDIEEGFDTGSAIVIPDLGEASVRLVVIRETEKENRKYPFGVFFNINGQLHGELDSQFISRRAKLDYVADSMIVTVDCTNLPVIRRENLFMTSRDRMRQGDEQEALQDAVIEYLKDHPGLRELNARRRQARLAMTDLKEDASAVIQSLLRADPALAALFKFGPQVKVPTGDVPEPAEYAGKAFPTYFRIRKEPKGGLVKQCPRNRTCRVEYETDAVNDYWSRAKDPGRISTSGNATLVSTHLWNGKALLRFAVPPNSNPGDTLRVTTSVTDVSRVAPFDSSFTIAVEPDAPALPPGGTPGPERSTLHGIPNVVEVRRDQWAVHGFTERSALIMKFGEGDALDVYVNMDNIHLRNEVLRRKSTDPELVGYWFKYGLLFLSLGMLAQQHKEGQDLSEVDAAPISSASEGLAMTIIPVIAQLGRGKP